MNTQETVGPDQWANTKVRINVEEQGLRHEKVNRRAVNEEGKPTGVATNDILLGNWAHKVDFLDGHAEILTACIIAENLLAEVDAERN